MAQAISIRGVMAVDKCVHVAQGGPVYIQITAENAGNKFYLCKDCFEIWDGDRKPDPVMSEAYHLYRSTDPNLPKDKWKRLTDKPVSKAQFRDRTREPGVKYYYYVTAINAIGLESHPSKVYEDNDIDPVPIDSVQ